MFLWRQLFIHDKKIKKRGHEGRGEERKQGDTEAHEGTPALRKQAVTVTHCNVSNLWFHRHASFQTLNNRKHWRKAREASEFEAKLSFYLKIESMRHYSHHQNTGETATWVTWYTAEFKREETRKRHSAKSKQWETRTNTAKRSKPRGNKKDDEINPHLWESNTFYLCEQAKSRVFSCYCSSQLSIWLRIENLTCDGNTTTAG